MNKKILALVLTAAISFSSAITAFAADTSTNISLDDKAKFSVTLQSNSLVFSNEPTDKSYDSISLEICNIGGTVLRNVTYDRGHGNGATLNVAGIPDGSYYVRVGYVNKGFKQYRDRYAYTLEVKSGVGTFKPTLLYANNLKAISNEKTDAATVSTYKGTPIQSYAKQVNIITAGITNDYDKVKAIHDWVANNMYYDFSDRTTVMGADANEELFPGSGALKRGICGNFAGVTTNLLRAAGFPAKTVSGNIEDAGEWIGHDWTEVFVEGRWLFMDTTLDCKNSFMYGRFSNKVKCTQTYFDTPVAEWSTTHELDGLSVTGQGAAAWNGSLLFIDAKQGQVLQEVKNFPVDGLLTSNYGYKASDLYSDAKLTIPWNFATNKINATNNRVYVKTYGFTVKFDSQGGSAINSVTVTSTNGLAKIPVPATPTKDGYTFKGWVVGNPYNSVLWDFNTKQISYDVTMYAKWQKN
ncbi:transglutaminase domain-containing protein [Clostridium beijerinckii]|uniref:Transglutaminase-like domain-containing protein n=1 Tax=Clostridium beijerinckii TaxID=1520 RepID=A0A1S9N0N0_CLOBE|nr:transglutaminase domain-containing protein [Clostridium beijerinckii]MZK53135.1 hypothetical protein [Clostridium beijerinckii]MZK61227.1 hypothetical protein [Clostridium beijerinckii]MZK71426.1 hypothetical protein [Clostridium beijerinckii]MZK76802.1 hypothetical protein [Clostridium beijerinckii]MZK86493.1 hypothetical protein [Clostridium beijerinckii]